MKIIKENKDHFKSVVIMDRGCGHQDYYGCIVMRDGLNYCRNCMYEIWQKDHGYSENGWKPDYNGKHGKPDYIFPIYSDGKDYYNERETTENN